MTKEEVNVDVKVDYKDIFSFLIYQNYHSKNGIIAIVLGIFALFSAIYTFGNVKQSYTMLFSIVAFVMLIYEPYALYIKAKNHMKKNAINNKVWHYSIQKKGLLIAIDEKDLKEIEEKEMKEEDKNSQDSANSVFLDWKMVFKIVKTKKALYIYTSRINAHIIPMKYLESEWESVSKILYRNVEQFRLKL